MTNEPDVAVRLSRLATELAIDLEALRARHAEVSSVLDATERERPLTRTELLVVAVNLHGWYTGLETALERIARLLDQTVPSGAAWHTELISQMQVEVRGLRPAALPASPARELHELRRFRHFFRNAYVLDFDPERLGARAADLRRVHQPVTLRLEALLAHIRAVLDRLG
jgi:hypothetical protein